MRALAPILILSTLLLAACNGTYPRGGGKGPALDTVWSINSGRAEDVLREVENSVTAYEIQQDWNNAWWASRSATELAQSVGDYQSMLTNAKKNLDITEKYLNGQRGVRPATNWVARAYLALNEYEEALLLLENILPKTRPVGGNRVRTNYAGYHETLGDLYLLKGRPRTALKHHLEAFNVVQDVVFTEFKKRRRGRVPDQMNDRYLRSLKGVARDHLVLENYAQAAEYAETLLRSAKELGFPDWEAEGNKLLGDIEFKRKNQSNALKYYDRAATLGSKLKIPEVTMWSYVGSARVQMAEGKIDEALGSFDKAMRIVERLRSLLKSGELRSSYFDDKIQIYSEAVTAQLKAGREDQAFRTMERSRARAFLDLLGTRVNLSRTQELIAAEIDLKRKTAEVNLANARSEDDEDEFESPNTEALHAVQNAYDQFLTKVMSENKEQASLITVAPLTLKEVQQLLDPAQVLLEYFVTADETILWVLDNQHYTKLKIPLARRNLKETLNVLRTAIAQQVSPEEYRLIARRIFDQLVAPALPHIRGKELIIVPHDVLHYLPFHALVGPDGRYLIENYPVSYLSSASLMQFTKEKRTARNGNVLAFGNPDLGDRSRDLDYAELEAEEVKSAYPGALVYVRREATEEKAKALSPQNDIIHFASHAALNENDPLSSALLLAKSGKEDGRLEVREIFGMNLKANLVVLSACDTGLGKLSTGDELVGLTRAFIYAGTPSVIASLWQVNDVATAGLMNRFYRNLKTMSKVEALRKAQLELIKGQGSSDILAQPGIGENEKRGRISKGLTAASTSESTLSHSPNPVAAVSTSNPYFWAPFILVGEGH